MYETSYSEEDEFKPAATAHCVTLGNENTRHGCPGYPRLSKTHLGACYTYDILLSTALHYKHPWGPAVTKQGTFDATEIKSAKVGAYASCGNKLINWSLSVLDLAGDKSENMSSL